MNNNDDKELRALFLSLRNSELKQARPWNSRYFLLPREVSINGWRWAFVAAAALFAMLTFQQSQRASLTHLPRLFDSAPASLFVGLNSSSDDLSTDYFLPTHLTIQLP
jgi:hypothetical protein